MELDIIIKELRKDNWLTGISFIQDNRDFLQAIVDETEKQLTIPVDNVLFICQHKYKDNICDNRGVRKCLNCSKLQQETN